MKKLLSLVTVFILLFALALPVWADEIDPDDLPSPVAGSGIEGFAVGDDSAQVGVSAADVSALDMEQLKEAAAASLDGQDVSAEDIAAIEVVDVTLDSAGGESIQVAFVHDDATKKLVSVLYLDPADNTWKPADFTVDSDGRVVVSVTDGLELAFVVSEVTSAPPSPAPSPASSTTSKPKSGRVKSPQTGYNTAVWTAVGAVMLLCAGSCFLAARKKSRT